MVKSIRKFLNMGGLKTMIFFVVHAAEHSQSKLSK